MKSINRLNIKVRQGLISLAAVRVGFQAPTQKIRQKTTHNRVNSQVRLILPLSLPVSLLLVQLLGQLLGPKTSQLMTTRTCPSYYWCS